MKDNVVKVGNMISVVLIAMAFILCPLATCNKAAAPTSDASEVDTTVLTTCAVDIPETAAVEHEYPLSMEEIELIALVTMAEAESEPELGKRLVIDTILNRVDHDRFPDTVKGVIYQPNQFKAMWNGRVDRCEVRDDFVQLVIEELESRANYHVIFFRTDHYGPYGTPMFSIGRHYFSEY